jgi:hypothetical protein
VGVIDDVGEVVGMQPHIQGMEYGSGRRDAEVGFQMLLTIREQGCDAISPGDACALQRGCEPARAPVQIAHGGSAARTVWLDGDDLYAGKILPARSRMLGTRSGQDIMADFMEPP